MNQEQEFTKKLDIAIWKKIIRLMKPHKKIVFTTIFINILIALLDTLFPIMNMYAISNFIENKDLSNLTPFSIAYVALFCFQALLIYIFICTAAKIETNIVYDIRKIGFEKLQELSFSYYDKTPVGWMISRMTTDAQRIGDVLAWSILDIFWCLFVIIFAIINMSLLNTKLTIYLSLMFPILLIISFYFQLKILDGQRKVRKLNSRITGVINESINGAKTTKTLVREEKNSEEFRELSGEMELASIKVAKTSAIYIPIINLVGSIGMAVILNIGGIQVLDGTISIAVFSVFMNYVVQMFEPIRNVARIFSEMQGAQASGERTFSLIETENEIFDSMEVIQKYGDSFNPIKENWEAINGEIEFCNVNFSYNTGEQVLKDFNLHVKPGEKIALVGETGSGKSTIVNLICRFYEPTSGKVLIDGTDYKNRSQLWLHSNLGYVLQAPHLFSGTIKDNIKYAKLDASDEEIINAAKQVNAYDFIMKFDKGFDTEVGEGGNRLSAGEKQLISFARAIVAKPKIFVLDEATSSVDTETEKIIQKAIETVLEGRTSFIIAHRLSTIRFCDKILVIKNGEILESGSHKELLKQKGYYFELYTNQFRIEKEEEIFKNS